MKDQSALEIESIVSSHNSHCSSTFLSSTRERILVNLQSLEQRNGREAENSVAVDAVINAMEHPNQRLQSLNQGKQPETSEDALQKNVKTKKQHRMQLFDGNGSMMGYRNTSMNRNASIYSSSGIVPSSRSIKKQLAPADVEMCMRRKKKRHHQSSTSGPVEAAQWEASPGNSWTASTLRDIFGKRAPQRNLENNLAFVSDDSLLDDTGSSKVSLKIIDVMRTQSSQGSSVHGNGDMFDTVISSSDIGSPRRAAGAASAKVVVQGARDLPPLEPHFRVECSPKVVTSSSESENRNSLRLRKASYSNNRSDNRFASPKKDARNSGTSADSALNNEKRDLSLRRLSSSRNLPIVWIRPPPPRQIPRPNDGLFSGGISTPLSRNSSSAGTRKGQMRALAPPSRPSSTRMLHGRQQITARPPLPLSKGSPNTSYVGAEPRNRHREGGSVVCYGGGDDNRPLQTDQQAAAGLSKSPARHAPVALSSHPALSSTASASLEDVLRRYGSGLEEQFSTPSGAASRYPRVDAPCRGDALGSSPLCPSPMAVSVCVMPSPQHQTRLEQLVPHPATKSPMMKGNGRGKGRGRVLPSTRVGHWQAPVTTAQQHVFVVPLQPLVTSRTDSLLPRQQIQVSWHFNADPPSTGHKHLALPKTEKVKASSSVDEYPTVAPSRTTTNAADEENNAALITLKQNRKRFLRMRKEEQEARAMERLAPYLNALHDCSDRGGRHPKRMTKRCLGLHRPYNNTRGLRHRLDYSTLAKKNDPLDHLLSRHGFWGEASKRY